MDICLSFDNGPEPEATPGVLDVLARRRIPALFFVIGEKLRAPSGRALAERVRDAGHVIGNHTLTHGAPLGRRSAAEALREISETEALLGDLAAPERYFRPNGGGGALGAHQITCNQHRWAHCRDDWRCMCRLKKSYIVKRNISVALKLIGHIPFGLSVAPEDDLVSHVLLPL